jgi:outer membrane protein OmpA-like peptidoglycan-associated protein
VLQQHACRFESLRSGARLGSNDIWWILVTLIIGAACASERVRLEQPVGGTHVDTPPRSEPESPFPSGEAPLAAPEEPPTCAIPNDYGDALRFPTDGFETFPRGTEMLHDLATCLLETGQSIVIIGYADPRGSEDHNFTLGIERAKAVRRILLRLGVPEERIDVGSCGEAGARGVGPESWKFDRVVAILPAGTEYRRCEGR